MDLDPGLLVDVEDRPAGDQADLALPGSLGASTGSTTGRSSSRSRIAGCQGAETAARRGPPPPRSIGSSPAAGRSRRSRRRPAASARSARARGWGSGAGIGIGILRREPRSRPPRRPARPDARPLRDRSTTAPRSELREPLGHRLELRPDRTVRVGPDGQEAGVVDLFEGPEVLLPVEDPRRDSRSRGGWRRPGPRRRRRRRPGRRRAGRGGRAPWSSRPGRGRGGARPRGRRWRRGRRHPGASRKPAEGLAGVRARLDREADAPMIGPAAELAEGVVEGRSAGLGRFRRDRPDPGQDEPGAEVVGHREGEARLVEPVVELLEGVERPSGRQVEGDQPELDRPERMPEVAAAGLGEPGRVQVAARRPGRPRGPRSGRPRGAAPSASGRGRVAVGVPAASGSSGRGPRGIGTPAGRSDWRRRPALE